MAGSVEVGVRNRWRDLQFGLRLLWKNPGFTTVAVLALALGIGANTAIFSVVNGVLIKPLPYPQSEALFGVWHAAPGIPSRSSGMAYPPRF